MAAVKTLFWPVVVLERVMYSSVCTDGARRVVVIPAHAGIQAVPPDLDPCVRRDDVS